MSQIYNINGDSSHSLCSRRSSQKRISHVIHLISSTLIIWHRRWEMSMLRRCRSRLYLAFSIALNLTDSNVGAPAIRDQLQKEVMVESIPFHLQMSTITAVIHTLPWTSLSDWLHPAVFPSKLPRNPSFPTKGLTTQKLKLRRRFHEQWKIALKTFFTEL